MDSEKTYVVIAANKNGELIPNYNVTVGDNYSIDVKLSSKNGGNFFYADKEENIMAYNNIISANGLMAINMLKENLAYFEDNTAYMQKAND